MSANRIASRYAKSLLYQALDSKVVDEVREDMEALSTLFENREMSLLLKSPIIDASKKKKVFDRVVSGQVQNVTSEFAAVLFRKKREGLLPLIVDAFVSQYDELKERSRIELTTAVKIADVQKEEIKKRIIASKVTHPNIVLETTIDEDIIGGFILQVGDRQYDASVKGQIENLKKKLTV